MPCKHPAHRYCHCRCRTYSVVVSWLAAAGSFALQTNNNLTTSNWVNFGGTVNSNGGTNSAIFSPPAGNLFFRLKQ
jgi:hypothetical protein